MVASRYSCCWRVVLDFSQGISRRVIQLASSAIYACRMGVRSIMFIPPDYLF
nr:MAG TPA: hypothetical protein [Caudoviricetes sp.]